MKNKKNIGRYVIVAILLLIYIFLENFHWKKTTIIKTRDFDRNISHIVYSQHAKCRMSCREITKQEVMYVLANGKINVDKSQLQGQVCEDRYAVEDYYNNQHIRLIVAPCNEKLTVITCIDLNKDWNCHCD